MSAVPPSPRGNVVVGYILPPRQEVTLQRSQEDGSDEDDDDEEEDPEFLDMGEMESLSDGGRMFQSSVAPRLEGKTEQQLCFGGNTVIVVLSALVEIVSSMNMHLVLQQFHSHKIRYLLKAVDSRLRQQG